jgi:hypothetical protein
VFARFGGRDIGGEGAVDINCNLYISIMKAIEVTVIPEYKLKVVFDDGVSGIADMQGLISKGIFSVLQDKHLFNKVYTTGYAIAWNEELEIDAIALYAEIVNKKPEEILSATLNYASN